MKERVKYCDALRLIAIISVVTIHVIAPFRDIYIGTNKLYYFILTFFDSLTRMGVPLFFMLTGMFMLNTNKEKTITEFYKKRLPKLVIPFFVLSIFYYLYECIINNVDMSFSNLLQQLTNSGGTKYHFWFMYAIIIIYFFIPFLRKLIKVLNKKELKTLILLIFIFGNVLYTINILTSAINYPLFNGIILPDIIRYTNYLFLGSYIQQYDIEKKTRKKIYIAGIICLFLLPVTSYIYSYPSAVRNDDILTANTILPFISSLAIFLYFKYNYQNFKIKKKQEAMLSKITPLIFYIYMIHVVVAENVVKESFALLEPTRFIEYFIILIIDLVIVFIASYFIAMILKKIYDFVASKLKSRKGLTI